MLNATNTALVIVDVQGKLAQIMDQKDVLFSNLETIVRGAKILDLPIVWVEQIPKKTRPDDTANCRSAPRSPTNRQNSFS